MTLIVLSLFLLSSNTSGVIAQTSTTQTNDGQTEQQPRDWIVPGNELVARINALAVRVLNPLTESTTSPESLAKGISDLRSITMALSKRITELESKHVTQSVQIPTTLEVSGGIRRVTLTWDNPYDTSISHYQYQQKQEGGADGTWTNIPKLLSVSNTFSYDIASLSTRNSSSSITTGTLYSYKLRAQHSSTVYSQPTDEVSARIKPDCSNGQAAGSDKRISRKKTGDNCNGRAGDPNYTSCGAGSYSGNAYYTDIISHCSNDGLTLAERTVGGSGGITCTYSSRGGDC